MLKVIKFNSVKTPNVNDNRLSALGNWLIAVSSKK